MLETYALDDDKKEVVKKFINFSYKISVDALVLFYNFCCVSENKCIL